MPPLHQPSRHVEWLALHNSYEQAERFSLLIKLTAVLLTAGLSLLGAHTYLTCLLVSTLWLQDAIWKTFQSRTEQRLLIIEKMAATDENANPAFYSEWLRNRPSFAKLILAYFGNAVRPTIAYPYPVLIALAIIMACIN
ncbi:hypothetical protein [Saccharophagus degradans]|nr:hypothetical protein [Saccharophagus degradans]